MDQGLRRISRRFTVALALATVGSLVVAGIALAASSTSGFSFLCSGRTILNKCPQSTYTKGKLSIHTHTNYPNPGSSVDKAKRIQVFFDNDFGFDPSVTPRCDPSELFNRDMSDAYDLCASKLIGTGRAQGVTAGGTINACMLLFNGPNDANGDPTIDLYFRAQVTNPSTITCEDPSSNHQGNTTIVLVGTLSTTPIGDYRRELDIPQLNTVVVPLSDLNFHLQKNTGTSGYVKARCFDADHVWNVTTFFTYSNNTTQTVNSTRTCTVG